MSHPPPLSSLTVTQSQSHFLGKRENTARSITHPRSSYRCNCAPESTISLLHGEAIAITIRFLRHGGIMKTQYLTLVALAGVAMATSVSAQSQGPVCEAKTFTVTTSHDAAPWITLNPAALGPACADADRSHLIVTSVSSPAVLVKTNQGQPTDRIRFENTLEPGQSMTLQYSVMDESGLSTTSTLKIVRQGQ